MALIGDALRQAFMPKHEYQSLREEEKAWQKLQRPLILILLTLITLAVFIATVISLKIVFPDDNLRRPFCRDLRIQPLSINFTTPVSGGGRSGESDLLPGAFVLTDQETVDYYWMVVFVPSAMVFVASVVYLIAVITRSYVLHQPILLFHGLHGIVVAYTAPARHGCLKVVENNYCASRKGGVRCLSILNVVFAVTFGLLALFLGSTLLTLGSSCSLPLFWCYEIASWGLVILHGGVAFFLRRKAAAVLDESDSSVRNAGIEMLEANPTEVTPDVERRVNEGFKAWMGPSFLSSDEEDEPDDYLEVPSITHSNSTRQRV
ncbi:hypothetical protein CDL12_25218 [Handroanthus impetiginosus]|uniref:Transmembrane protein n=1 Tax=Handroanthus impetiginosus TaxID=429701 RepID=A0A2G9GAF9_9LAMI|nr:hypothetical protein CDL12_25218 [Handroanthus impetiginosus]